MFNLYFIHSSVSPEPNWYQIENKTCYIPKICNFSVGKRYVFFMNFGDLGMQNEMYQQIELKEMGDLFV